MAGHGEKRTRRQEQAIVALMTEPTLDAAAGRAGVSANTLGRWLKDAAFLAAYRAARRNAVETAIARIQDATSEAVDALRRNLKAERPSDQIRAAATIINNAWYGIELIDLAERVETLESRLADSPDHSPMRVAR